MQKDAYLVEGKAEERLYQEWAKYGKIIIAYDYDDTVFDFHKKGYTYINVIELLRKCKEFGAFLIVHTACSKEQEPEMVAYLNSNNIPFDTINENAPFTPFTGRKCYYNIMLDDRAGLIEAFEMLTRVANKIGEAK